MIVGLMSRELQFDCSKMNGSEQSIYQVGPYNYKNPSDSQYCSQMIVDENANDSNCDFPHFEDFGDVATEDFVHRQAPITSDNLIDEPEFVPKNCIQYATKAKKMDMKKLKNEIWKCIIDNETIPQSNVAKKHTFSEVMQQLPFHLNESMRQELSTPLAFVALLHLANEHNLKLTQVSDLQNFILEQEESTKKNL